MYCRIYLRRMDVWKNVDGSIEMFGQALKRSNKVVKIFTSLVIRARFVGLEGGSHFESYLLCFVTGSLQMFIRGARSVKDANTNCVYSRKKSIRSEVLDGRD